MKPWVTSEAATPGASALAISLIKVYSEAMMQRAAVKPQVTDEVVHVFQDLIGDLFGEGNIRKMVEVVIPLITADFAARLEAPGSGLCDCNAQGTDDYGDPNTPTNLRTGLPMAHHCECRATLIAAVLLGPGVLTAHEKECSGPELWARLAAGEDA